MSSGRFATRRGWSVAGDVVGSRATSDVAYDGPRGTPWGARTDVEVAQVVSRTSRTGRRKGTALMSAGLLAGALLLGGCAADPGAAAVAEGRTISQNLLQQTQQELSSFLPGAEASNVLVALIVAPHFIEAAAEHGVGVSSDDALALIDQNLAQAGVEDAPSFGEGSLDVIRFTMAAQNLQRLPDGAEVLLAVDQEIREMDVEVNPRYGDFDRDTGAIVARTRPWIVTPQQ